MIAKIIAYGTTRAEAIARLRRALHDTHVVIAQRDHEQGVRPQSARPPGVRAGDVDVRWVDGLTTTDAIVSDHAEVAIIAAAIDAYRTKRAIEVAAFRAAALRGRPKIDDHLGRTVDLRHRGQTFRIHLCRLGPGDYRITVDGHTIEANREDLGRSQIVLTVGGRRHRVVSSVNGITHFVDVDGHPHRILHDEGGAVRSPAPAVVVSIDVAVGDTVEIGDPLAVIEAMKMETSIVAEFAGTDPPDRRPPQRSGAGRRPSARDRTDRRADRGGDRRRRRLSFADLATDGDVAPRSLLATGSGDPPTPARLRPRRRLRRVPRQPGADPCVRARPRGPARNARTRCCRSSPTSISLFGREAEDEDEPLFVTAPRATCSSTSDGWRPGPTVCRRRS